MMASCLRFGALLAGLIGGLAVPSGSAGETPAEPLMREPRAANPAPAGRGARDLPCARVQGMATDHSGSTPASVAVAGSDATGIADYVAMHRHATQAPPFSWQRVQNCAAQ